MNGLMLENNHIILDGKIIPNNHQEIYNHNTNHYLNNQLIQLSLKDKSTVEDDLYKFCNTFTMYSLNALNMGNFIYDYQSDKKLITNLSDFILK